ncbi:uncharacterized protein LOC122503234, partial [Leptopilina heterotoma]|uniref:uncharacterized protein LOC122503234 n=1 Tax=Leptopilina heterotoma TaxID=63436 RepID=UPI001CA9C4DB
MRNFKSRCARRTGRFRCKFTLVKENGVYVKGKQNRHSCNSFNTCAEKNNTARKIMIERCKDLPLELKSIFDSVRRELENDQKPTNLNYKKEKQVMLRVRRKMGYKQPTSLLNVAEIIFSSFLPSVTLLKAVIIKNDKTALIFSSANLIEKLNEVDEIFLDGTFKAVGAVFILMTRRSSDLYTAVFEKLNEFCPMLTEKLRMVMGDCEAAVMKSIRETYSNCRIQNLLVSFKE